MVTNLDYLNMIMKTDKTLEQTALSLVLLHVSENAGVPLSYTEREKVLGYYEDVKRWLSEERVVG